MLLKLTVTKNADVRILPTINHSAGHYLLFAAVNYLLKLLIIPVPPHSPSCFRSLVPAISYLLYSAVFLDLPQYFLSTCSSYFLVPFVKNCCLFFLQLFPVNLVQLFSVS
jgi:hypothetical protein